VQLRCTALTPEELHGRDHVLLAEMTHQSLAEFVIEYFLKRTSWLTRLHHLMSLATVIAIIAIADSWMRALAGFAFAFLALFLIVLPVHELLHALAYRLAGARDIRWDYSWRMAAVWVIAHRFVATAKPFIAVALAPFVVINAALIAGAIAFPPLAVFLLFLLLWHLHGSIGDWSLLNFIWLHRRRGFWTYDDAVTGKSYFFGRV
jgi:hypothetical protein